MLPNRISYFILIWSSLFYFKVSAQKYPKMVKVEGGTFIMGNLLADSTKDFNTPRQVIIMGFLISKTPVTVNQYKKYCYSMGLEMPNLPVEINVDSLMVNVSWDDAQSYCRWLSKQTGKKYRLPTEAEWEYASKGAHLSARKQDKKEFSSMQKWDNDAILKANGKIWEWVADVFQENNTINKKLDTLKRVTRKGTTGKKTMYEQPYHKAATDQNKSLNNLGFSVAESIPYVPTNLKFKKN